MHMWMKYWGGGRFVFDDKVLCTARNPGTMDDFGSTIWIVSMISSHDDDSEDGRWMKKSPVPFSAALSLTGYYRLILQIHRIPYKKIIIHCPKQFWFWSSSHASLGVDVVNGCLPTTRRDATRHSESPRYAVCQPLPTMYMKLIFKFNYASVF